MSEFIYHLYTTEPHILMSIGVIFLVVIILELVFMEREKFSTLLSHDTPEKENGSGETNCPSREN